jgi:uncharacterized membrane protein YoaT (DUF817 family)
MWRLWYKIEKVLDILSHTMFRNRGFSQEIFRVELDSIKFGVKVIVKL